MFSIGANLVKMIQVAIPPEYSVVARLSHKNIQTTLNYILL